jgi:excinuclease ABC subunit A
MVEHDEDCIRAADHLIDIGPGAGSHGGNVVAAGPMPAVLAQDQSTTIRYITGAMRIAVPEHRRPVDPTRPASRSRVAKATTSRTSTSASR